MPFMKKGDKMVIKAFSIPEEVRDKVLASFRKQVKITIDGCWEWQGRIHNGYGSGHFTGLKSSLWAHRVAYALFNGPIEAGNHVDHVCNNPVCVRPDHLEQKTPTKNYKAIHRRQRRKHLPCLITYADSEHGINPVFRRNDV
jgi:hypothetical protein